MMKCKICNGERFMAQLIVHMDVYVNGNGDFDGDSLGDVDANTQHVGEPFGPFVCCQCGAEYEELDRSDPASGPVEEERCDEPEVVLSSGKISFKKTLDRCDDAKRRYQWWESELYSVAIMVQDEQIKLNVHENIKCGEDLLPLHVVHDSGLPLYITVRTPDSEDVVSWQMRTYGMAMMHAAEYADAIAELFISPLRKGVWNVRFADRCLGNELPGTVMQEVSAEQRCLPELCQ